MPVAQLKMELKLNNENSLTLKEVQAKTQLTDFLGTQYKAIAASYFNSAILEVSIPLVNQFYKNGIINSLISLPNVGYRIMRQKIIYQESWYQILNGMGVRHKSTGCFY